MKLFNLDHISILPYTTCNFKCPYCCTTNKELTLRQWDELEPQILKFLQSLPKKAIMVSGGEPLLWNWSKLINNTDHTWYFLTNGSVIPEWVNKQDKIKLFIAAFHKSQIELDKFIYNIRKLEKPTFVKVVYTGMDDIASVEKLIKENIPASLTPEVNSKYNQDQVELIKPYITSQMYLNRFLGVKRSKGKCNAGTALSFELTGTKVNRCSHNSCKFIGEIDNPKLYNKPKNCSRKTCYCEWHQFSELSGGEENERWQKLVDTGKW